MVLSGVSQFSPGFPINAFGNDRLRALGILAPTIESTSYLITQHSLLSADIVLTRRSPADYRSHGGEQNKTGSVYVIFHSLCACYL
jgi:hypothetical protein